MESLTTNYQRYKLIIFGILFLWTLSIFLPGAYSIDSWNQFNEVSSGRYDDWYGTGFATTWRILWLISGNYMSLYVVQMLLYWLFFTVLLWRVSLKSILYWLTLGIALFFCFIPQYVMRDSLMVLLWAVALLLLLRAGAVDDGRRRLTILVLILLAYGLWIRINMLIALLPLAYVCVVLLARRIALWKQLLLTLGISAFLFFGGRYITYHIQGAPRQYPEYKWKLLDLTGISRLSGENWFPAPIRNFPGFNLDSLYKRYSPAGIDDIYWPEDGEHIFPWPNDSLYASCSVAWKAAVKRHPIYYLENRLNGFLYYLHLRRRFQPTEYYNVAVFWIQPNGPVPAKAEPTALKDKISRLYLWFYSTLIFAPWFWLLLNLLGCIAFFYLHWKRPDGLYWLIHACIQLSGVFFVFSQVLVYQTDRDFRFTYWNIFVAVYALVGFFSRRLVPAASRQAAVA